MSLGLFMFFLSVSYFILRSGYESNPSPPLISPSRPPRPPFVSCSESVLELSIMPKDEDVLQLVSANMQTHTSDSRTHFISLCQNVTGSSLWFLFVMIHAVIMEECEDFSKTGCGVTQPLSALCLDYNTYSLKASGIKAYV